MYSARMSRGCKPLNFCNIIRICLVHEEKNWLCWSLVGYLVGGRQNEKTCKISCHRDLIRSLVIRKAG